MTNGEQMFLAVRVAASSWTWGIRDPGVAPHPTWSLTGPALRPALGPEHVQDPRASLPLTRLGNPGLLTALGMRVSS